MLSPSAVSCRFSSLNLLIISRRKTSITFTRTIRSGYLPARSMVNESFLVVYFIARRKMHMRILPESRRKASAKKNIRMVSHVCRVDPHRSSPSITAKFSANHRRRYKVKTVGYTSKILPRSLSVRQYGGIACKLPVCVMQYTYTYIDIIIRSDFSEKAQFGVSWLSDLGDPIGTASHSMTDFLMIVASDRCPYLQSIKSMQMIGNVKLSVNFKQETIH